MTHIIDEIETKCSEYQAKLVIVSKMRTLSQMDKYYEMGYRNFGENKVQELLTKVDWHKDVNWHFIGRLQTNKVKEVVKHCALIHSLNRYELMEAIEKEACKQNKKVSCLLQFNIACEETKSGFLLEDKLAVLEQVKKYPHIAIKGLMCMGPHVEDEEAIGKVFKQAKDLFEEYKQWEDDSFMMQYLSMGMSDDYLIALENGSNMLRIGSVLFKEG